MRTLPICGRRRESFHFRNARFRRSDASDCSLLALPDRPAGCFEPHLSVTQVRRRVAIVISQYLTSGRVQFIQNRILSHSMYHLEIRPECKSTFRKVQVHRAIYRHAEAHGRSLYAYSFESIELYASQRSSGNMQSVEAGNRWHH